MRQLVRDILKVLYTSFREVCNFVICDYLLRDILEILLRITSLDANKSITENLILVLSH